MKNAGRIAYVVLCFLICIVPSVGMFVHATNTTTENKELAEFPDLKEDGKWNANFMQELGSYFEDHFAFRPELVTADAKIQSSIFKVSNVDTVTVGTNGWLYYTSTVKDYLGQDIMSERGILNAAHNLSLVQQYVQEQGAEFLLAVPPNKNSLYGQNMPYYFQKKAGNVRNMDLLKKEIKKQEIPYTDLFSLFEKQNEVLYLKRDSHWNNKGAALAYDALLNQLGLLHDHYESIKALRQKDDYGDLNKMLYPLGEEPEWNYSYQKEDAFFYKTDTKSVEDALEAAEIALEEDDFVNHDLDAYLTDGMSIEVAQYDPSENMLGDYDSFEESGEGENAGGDSGRTIVSKEKIYDCDGSGHGYYAITWSDGSVEFEDF